MKNYPAKILLFGEHTVNLGSQALAIPFSKYFGHWDFLDNKVQKEKQMHLFDFAEYLYETPLQIQLDVNRFKEELGNGLYFKSNIPVGYGAGSSGALVAAIFDRYCMVREGKELKNLKKTFSQMENFFHGTSSGTDPLICYLNQAIILDKKEIKNINLSVVLSPFTLFLLDTKIPRSGTPFIEYFLNKSEEEEFSIKLADEYLPVVDSAIINYVGSQWGQLFQDFGFISHFQFDYLDKLIPIDFMGIWKHGLASDFFKLKICGAGGGGFILGMTNNFEKIINEYSDLRFIKI